MCTYMYMYMHSTIYMYMAGGTICVLTFRTPHTYVRWYTYKVYVYLHTCVHTHTSIYMYMYLHVKFCKEAMSTVNCPQHWTQAVATSNCVTDTSIEWAHHHACTCTAHSSSFTNGNIPQTQHHTAHIIKDLFHTMLSEAHTTGFTYTQKPGPTSLRAAGDQMMLQYIPGLPCTKNIISTSYMYMYYIYMCVHWCLRPLSYMYI